MHNLRGRQSAQLDTFSGLVTIANPQDLTAGASPRNQNMDFNVGSAITRGPLINPFVYAGNSAGPSLGDSAANSPITGNAWSNPTSVLGNSTFATCALNNLADIVSSSGNAFTAGTGISWTTPFNLFASSSSFAIASNVGNSFITSILGAANLGLSVPDAATIRGISVSLNGKSTFVPSVNISLVANGSVVGNPQSLSFGNTPSVQTAGSFNFLWGYDGWDADSISTLEINISSSSFFTGTNSHSVSLNGLTVTVYYMLSGSDAIQVETFGFSVPSSASPQGFAVSLNGFSTSVQTAVNVQMLKDGTPTGSVRSATLPISAGPVTFGGINDLFDADWTFADINNTQFGLQITATAEFGCTVSVNDVTITVYFLPTQHNFNYVTTFEDSFGNIRTLALDDTGEWWVENVTTNPGTFSSLMSGAPEGSFANSFTTDSKQYIATSDLLQGNYVPQQYTGQWTDRVSQVGPGAAPTFTPILTSDTYNITSITQPSGQSRGSSYFLQSTGPGSTAAGNVVTVYYSDSTVSGPDTDLVNAFNSGNPVYVYTSFTGGPSTQGPYTVQVTSVGEGQPPGQPRQFYYFTYTLTTNVFTYYQGSGHPGFTANYQRSLATMTMGEPVPGVIVGSVVTIAGSSIAGYDGSHTITQTLNSGTFTITDTSVSSGVATYTYSLIDGVAPAAGQTVTISGTNNADGALNLVNATIVTSSGGSTGTFTINVSLPDAAPASEEGQASTAGSIFTFDPGAADAGSSTNPILGNATGGTITFSTTGQFVTPGTRKGTVFFITRNGFWTAPAPPVTFAAAGTTITGIKAANIPIGPPNVVARAIAFTEAGANGVPGANFYTIPDPVQYIVNNVTYTATSLFINDNVSTTATFFFNDSVLLDATEIDIQGNDLFNLGELGDSAWCTQYAGRTVWGRVRNKIQNFLNLTFDGGYLANPGGNLLPLGWNVVNSTIPQGSSPTLLNSPVFGNSYYMNNTSGSTQAQFCMIYQSAYQDYNQVAILQNQTAYSVRVTCRTPSSATDGALVVDLTAFDAGTGFGNTYGSFTLALSSITSNMATYEGTLLITDTLNIPSDLVLRVWGQNIAAGGDIEIDRIEIFPTMAPTNLTGLTMSYQNDPESFDLVTGGQDTSVVNNQPANGAFEMHSTLYVVKESSLGFFKDSPNQEPANWNPFEEVSNVAGACGINAYDVGEEWAVMACQNGLFLFNGGQPVPIQLEIPDIWRSINWQYGHTICVRNDVAHRKIFCAIPLPTPNPWMKVTTVNPNPTAPNVILMLNYDGIGSVETLMEAAPLHVTMAGKLAVHDFRRKWSLWPIPTPYMGMVKRNELEALMMFCNGIDSSKIYYLGDTPTGIDDSGPFTSSYCTYGFVDPEMAQGNPMFGQYNKRFAYVDVLANGNGTADMTFYQNTLDAPYPYSIPGGVTLTENEANDLEYPLDEFAQRLFVEVTMENGWFNLSRLTLAGAADKWSVIRGV